MATSNKSTLEEARAAKSKAAALLTALPVIGIGITRIGDGYVKVNLSESVADTAGPKHVNGVPIKTEVVGAIRSDDSHFGANGLSQENGATFPRQLADLE